MFLYLFIFFGVVVGGLAWAGSGEHPGDSGKYHQTWATDYAVTTCGDFVNVMSASQRFTASADMLVGARKRVEGDPGGMPSDELVGEFTRAVDASCGGAMGSRMTDAGMLAYRVGRAAFRPY